ncbi:hypothetical protein [Granulicella sp. L60]|uniref:hypothetical protein n=1 Tax=Granulicella sp. L60 TaxID=1641866 RepID=UPI00131E00C4|nr:hypothetical protein [Granulicella sp. L60]
MLPLRLSLQLPLPLQLPSSSQLLSLLQLLLLLQLLFVVVVGRCNCLPLHAVVVAIAFAPAIAVIVAIVIVVASIVVVAFGIERGFSPAYKPTAKRFPLCRRPEQKAKPKRLNIAFALVVAVAPVFAAALHVHIPIIT